MPCNSTDIINGALTQVLAGRSPEEVKLYTDLAEALMPDAYLALARNYVKDPIQRGYLRKRFTVPVNNGVSDQSNATWKAIWDKFILREGLQFADVFDADDSDERYRYVWRDNWHELTGYVDWRFGYFAQGQGSGTAPAGSLLYFRKRNDSTQGSRYNTPDPITLYTTYIPDGSTDYPIPSEAKTDLEEILRGMVLQRKMESAAIPAAAPVMDE